MGTYEKLISFLSITSSINKQSIVPNWDGHKWITLVDLPSIGKFGLGSSNDRRESIDMAIDHAVLFIDDYLKEHPEIKIENKLGDYLYEVIESQDGSILLKINDDN